MKRLLAIIMFILSVGCAIAQHTADIGVQVAAATYWGDIQKQNTAKSITPAVGILGRWNFNKRLAVRGQILVGNLTAVGIFNSALIGQSGTRAPNFPADPNYVYKFSRSFQTVEGLFEFNFRNYKLGSTKKELFTPFVSLGIGAFYSGTPRTGSFILDPNIAVPAAPAALTPVPVNLYSPFSGTPASTLPLTNGYKVLTLVIPVGAGFKFNFSKRLGGIAELIVRKTFSDNIDNLNDPKRFQNPVLVGSPQVLSYDAAKTGLNNNDWYATLAFSLTWQLWNEKGNCALYDKLKNKK